MMASMPGCSVRRQCDLGGALGAACDDFSLLVHVCTQMPSMASCAAVSSLCAKGSAVEACSNVPASLKRMLTASDARSAALAVCEAMPSMSACGTCRSGSGACPDPLLSVSKLCRAMPSMDSCAPWEAWCLAPGSEHDLPAYCGGVPHDGGGVPMRMYFHLDWRDYILFKGWTPHDAETYVLALAAVALSAVGSAWLRAVRVVFECSQAGAPGGGRRHRIFRANAARALLVTVSSGLDYLLMLVAMTYNVGLFLAVVVGLGVGTLAFGHWGRTASPVTVPDNAAPFLPAQIPEDHSTCH